MSKINVKNFGVYHPYVFYHNDMDGKCSAWLLHSHFEKNHIPDSPSDYQHYCYDENMKLGSVNNNTVVYIVDISFTEKTEKLLREICDKAAHVIWIDHHDSSVNLLKTSPDILNINNLHVFVSKDACGAILTAVYLKYFLEFVHPLEDNYQKFKDPSERKDENWFDPRVFSILEVCLGIDEVTPFIDLKILCFTTTMYIDDYLEMIDDHDRWQMRNRNTRAFIEGTNIENTSIVYKTINNKIEFNNGFWGYLDKTAYDYIDSGSAIIKYKDKKASDELSQTFEWIEPETGARIICKNDRGDSNVFLDLYNVYDAVLLFRYDGKTRRWFYSVYNDVRKTFNCAAFCLRFGGGGHYHAAGFNTEKLIFDI